MHVQPQRAGGVGDVADALAGQAQAQVILGRQHAGNPAEQLRLMLAQPQQLGRGQPRHRQAAGDAGESRMRALQPLRLCQRARIVPQDRRAQHMVVPVQQHCAMHLS
jgi:hypothetical protein